MSADGGTALYKAYWHKGYIHVVQRAGDGPFDSEYPLGNFSPEEITELAQLAGQAWPADPRVEVRYVIECRKPGREDWGTVWSALADEDDESGGFSETAAGEVLAGFRGSGVELEWQLVRRTILTADEPVEVTPDGS